MGNCKETNSQTKHMVRNRRVTVSDFAKIGARKTVETAEITIIVK